MSLNVLSILLAFTLSPAALAQTFPTQIGGIYRMENSAASCTATQVARGVFLTAAHCLPRFGDQRMTLVNHLNQKYSLQIARTLWNPIFNKYLPQWQASGKSFGEFLRDLGKRDPHAMATLGRKDLVMISLNPNSGDFARFVQSEPQAHCMDSVQPGDQLMSVGMSPSRPGLQSSFMLNAYRTDSGLILRERNGNGDGRQIVGDSGGPVFARRAGQQKFSCMVAVNQGYSLDGKLDRFSQLGRDENFLALGLATLGKQMQVQGSAANSIR